MSKTLTLLLILSLLCLGFSTPKPLADAPILTPPTQESDTSGAKKFWDTLKNYCGKAFEGEIVSGPAGDDFNGKRLVMYVLFCSENQILIPFNVGDNRSRTWVLTYKEGRIELKHDHRHEDGQPDKVTMYGGTTSNSGLPGLAVFPADEETLGIIPAAATNVWWITVDDTTYTYNLRRIGTDRLFTVAFDLRRPIEKPEPSWGWENFVAPKP